ncbi:cysteine dioxygenase type 1-like [Oppia nitens]|uniref:cysteine dioxygenase type 1-like n=1 Tax=Oppia nitens TaxID=1686743 RepID=UPI0023DB847D|nr:cysteine dioxygenase type 1-like [Oppia nitens]
MNDNNNSKQLPSIKTLDDLIYQLRQAFASNDIDVDYVQNLMLSYESNSNDWSKYAHFDDYTYTRNLVDKGNGKYNLILVCWTRAAKSRIHDHSDSHCFMKVLAGDLHEVRYEWPDNSTNNNNNKSNDDNCTEKLKILNENEMPLNSVTYINDSMGIHHVENPGPTGPVSLHLYIPPHDMCQVFDKTTGSSNNAKLTFYSQYGSRTPFTLSSSSTPKTLLTNL